jgi:hypothetical protein
MYRRNFLTLPILGLLPRMLPRLGSLAFAGSSETASSAKARRFWYRQPAKDCNPVGQGRQQQIGPFSDLKAILTNGHILQYDIPNYGRQKVTISIHQIGELVLTSGTIVAWDPLMGPDMRYYLEKALKPGRYTVILSAAYFQPVNYSRLACAMLRISERPTVSWEPAIIHEPNSAREKKRNSYNVDSGTGCFMDLDAARVVAALQSADLRALRASEENRTPEPASRFEQEFCDKVTAEMDRHTIGSSRTGFWANVRVSNATEANVIAFSSGWGDGSYASFWGHDASGNVTSLVTDFDLFSA